MSVKITTLKISVLIFMVFLRTTASAGEQLIRVVTTMPVLSDIVREIGGDEVAVTSLTGGKENVHTYRQKPSDIIKVEKADLFIKVGAGLDSWADKLVHGEMRVLTASDGITLIDVSPGHKNPHFWLDPLNVIKMADSISSALVELRPGHEAIFSENMNNYVLRLKELDREIETLLSGLKNRKIITYHPAWPYFSNRYRLEVTASILTQEGSEPSVSKLAGLIGLIKREHVSVIISEPTANLSLPEMLSDETGIKVVHLALIPGSMAGTETYIDMMRTNALKLSEVLN